MAKQKSFKLKKKNAFVTTIKQKSIRLFGEGRPTAVITQRRFKRM